MEEIKTCPIRLEDGRKADKIIQETSDPASGESKIVTEIHAEPVVPKHLVQRIVETKRPVVVRREIESVDELTGEVLDRKVESVSPDVKMELREHIQTNSTVAALSAKDDCDCYVTKEDMLEGFKAIARALSHNDEPVAAVSVNKISMQEVVADKVSTKSNVDWTGIVLWGIIASMSAAFAYVVFLM